MAMYGYVGLCMAMYGYLGLCRAMYGYVGLCRSYNKWKQSFSLRQKKRWMLKY